MDTMAERVKRALEIRGMTPTDLINRKVLSKAGIYFILDGTTKSEKIRATTLDKLSRALGVNAEWIQHGRGPMEGSLQISEGDWDDVKGYSQAVGLGGGPEASEYAETHKLKFKASSLARKRLRANALAVMYGSGDSMYPRIHSGDAILFDTSDTRPRDGALFVILVPGAHNNEYQVKRCEQLDDIVYFKADNPTGDHNWKKAKRMDDKRHPIQIIGRVRWIGSWED
jgi:phage repressor protein C with HTH and peptisase S24 domain